MRMRAIGLLLAFGFLAGCSAPGTPGVTNPEQFRALAMAAPGLLKSDQGPHGNLTRVTGHTTMHVTTAIQNQTMVSDMTDDTVQEYFQGDSYLTTMSMRTSMTGMTTDMTMRMFCSPTKLIVQMDATGFSPATNETQPNPTGKCDTASGDPKELFQGTGGQSSPWASLAGDGAVPELKFKTVAKEDSKDVAVYETTMNVGEQGGSMNMTVETRAAIENGRIDHMTMTGKGSMDMGDMGMPSDGSAPDGNVTMEPGLARMSVSYTFDGTMGFEYSTRGAVPREFA